MLHTKPLKILEENISSKILDIACSNILPDISPQAREAKGKNKQMGPYQTIIQGHSNQNSLVLK